MVIEAMVTRSGRERPAGRGRAGSRGPARSQGLSASRVASAAQSTRRTGGRGRARPTARTTSPRSSGAVDDGEVRRLLADLQAKSVELTTRLEVAEGALQAGEGAIRKVQHELADFRGRQSDEPMSGVGDGEAGPPDGDEDVAYAGTGRSPPDAAPAEAPASLLPLVSKEVRTANFGMWRSPATQRM